ncbi:predicted protein [Candida tropicalis MYA-3404]|uniref:Uncharacterized protein n=1 Tax=Candida tropicalis (strain ATCC MYA-3404 / T1) TaxID=294747 RepID=C5MGR7_CANTT|nr:predicted protein [Candida tropicalis MYA-3404]EER30819.1 predicted protein [Candida tropicalis MYA-3404]KAG4404377.1 hypothetical protein JTP64_006129 [Candida tropicalis]MCP8716335.1 hypothetical protein [Asgard group archaeon]
MKEVPMINRFIVGTFAILLGGYVTYKSGSDFQFMKFTPHSPEEIERRKRENIGFSVKFTEDMTLDLTPEAKLKYEKMRLEKLKHEEEKEKNKNKE